MQPTSSRGDLETATRLASWLVLLAARPILEQDLVGNARQWLLGGLDLGTRLEQKGSCFP